tara:strand:- start:3540 stop:4163 length:624 start_codon:yes stop_codon:yes gene_type:complete
MGFDVYGLNPKVNEVPPTILSKFYDENGWNNWAEMTEKDKERYFLAQDEHQELNPGEYFRANVWFWRPIWTFVCGACSDFLSDDDMEAGGSNSGDRICKTKANRIASRIRKLDKQGIIQTWEDEMMISYNEAKEHNKIIDKEMDVFQDKMRIKYGKNIVPNKYDDDDRRTWDSIYHKRSWASSYPPSRDSIVKFGIFCGESGGFEIC